VNAKVASFGCLNTQLAKDQTKVVLDLLQEVHPRLACRVQVVPSPVDPQELEDEPFLAASAAEVEHLEEQLLAGEFRLAVVRALDLVLPLRPGLRYVAIPRRNNPFDAFLTRRGQIIDEMSDGAAIGVLNLRSRTQVAALWPHHDVHLLRGGMHAALESLLRRCDVDGLVAPAAAAEHLGLQSIVAEIFNPELIMPSGGQGILVVLGREDDGEAVDLLAPLHCGNTEREMEAEHAFLQRFASDLELPVGVLARCNGDRLRIAGVVGSSDAAAAAIHTREGAAADAAMLGIALAEELLQDHAALIGLLEAEFPEGVPEEEDEIDPDLEVFEELAGHEDHDDHDDHGDHEDLVDIVEPDDDDR
jgi:hydroxymethylbilane synthase